MASGMPKFNFPGPVGSKRRRMRSGGNVSTQTNNSAKNVTLDEADDVGEQVVQTSKCKGATTIPIFLKKTYKMIDTCDPSIASWTEDGEMFVVRDPDIFATQIIPQYFDHNKFSSFARQLNFYGFRKMQSKPIRNSDYDIGTAKHVTFYNENFKRGRCDLLKKIQRSTRGSGATTGQDQAREIQNLRDQVSNLEQKLQDTQTQMEERLRRLELDMLARMEQVMMAMQQQQQAQLQLQSATSVGTVASNAAASAASAVAAPAADNNSRQQSWSSTTAAAFARGNSVGSNVLPGNPFPVPQQVTAPSVAAVNAAAAARAGPTLPPHPKQKQLPLNGLPGVGTAPAERLNSLRGISMLSRGVSGLPRGTSVESTTSAVLLRNSWEDKFFSMLMLDENGQAAANAAALGVTPTPIGPNASLTSTLGLTHADAPTSAGPATVSDGSKDVDNRGISFGNAAGLVGLGAETVQEMPI